VSGTAPAVNIQPLTFLIMVFTTSGFLQSYSFPYSEFVILLGLLPAQPHGIPSRSRDVWPPFFFSLSVLKVIDRGPISPPADPLKELLVFIGNNS